MSKGLSEGFLSLEKEKGCSSVDSDEIRGHEKEILTKGNIVINMLYLLYKSKCCMTTF